MFSWPPPKHLFPPPKKKQKLLDLLKHRCEALIYVVSVTRD